MKTIPNNCANGTRKPRKKRISTKIFHKFIADKMIIIHWMNKLTFVNDEIVFDDGKFGIGAGGIRTYIVKINKSRKANIRGK